MADPIWQNLQKSLDDPETIEQAITRIVGDHNNSPDSHLGVGQSLENHKTADIIDHPAGSVVVDKFAYSQCDYNLFFYDFGVWNKTTNKNPFSNDAYLGIVSIELNESDSRAFLSRDVLLWQDFLFAKKSFTISSNFTVEWYFSTGDYFYWGISGNSYNSVPVLGFASFEGALKVCYRSVNAPSVPVFVNVSISIPVDLTPFSLSLIYDNVSDVLTWVYNGVIVYSLSSASSVVSFDGDSVLSYMLYTPSESYLALSIFAPRILVDFSL